MDLLRAILIFSLTAPVISTDYTHQLNGIWTQLEEMNQKMSSMKTQRNSDFFLRSVDELSVKFDAIYAKMSNLEQTLQTKYTTTTGKDVELLRTLQRIEHTLRSPAASTTSDGGLTVNNMQNLLQFTASELERSLESKLRDLFDAQHRLIKDLFDKFKTNFATQQAHTHYVTSDRVPTWIQETMVRGLDAFTIAMKETMDTKLHQFLSSVQNLCQNNTAQVSNMSKIAASGDVQAAMTRQRGRTQQVYPRRQYSATGVDIIGQQPQSRQSQNLKFSVRPPVQAEYWAGKPKDCAEIYRMGYHKTGVYEAYIDNERNTMLVFCDMDTNGGGWTVIQRRDDQMIPHENFDRPWGQYKSGFGNLDREFWIGNHYIHQLTSRGPATLRIETVDTFGLSGYAEYDKFGISNEFNSYKMHIGLYFEGSLKDEFTSHNNSYFSTPEEDNDKHPGRNCAETFYSGWWYDNCFRVNLNGIHVVPANSKAIQGMYWGFKFPGNVGLRLRASEMKLRPVWFSLSRG